jgi:hypothetical protein
MIWISLIKLTRRHIWHETAMAKRDPIGWTRSLALFAAGNIVGATAADHRARVVHQMSKGSQSQVNKQNSNRSASFAIGNMALRSALSALNLIKYAKRSRKRRTWGSLP